MIHPITNPDGAQLAYDLYKITPDYMLHAGYLGPLGVTLRDAMGQRPDLSRIARRGRSCGARGCPTSSSIRTAIRRTSGCSCSPSTPRGFATA